MWKKERDALYYSNKNSGGGGGGKKSYTQTKYTARFRILCSTVYKMTYFSSHQFAFSNLHFCAILRTFSSITREICVQIEKNKVHHVNQLIEPDLMIYIYMTFPKKTLRPLHLPIQNILLAVNPFHCFFAKSF